MVPLPRIRIPHSLDLHGWVRSCHGGGCSAARVPDRRRISWRLDPNSVRSGSQVVRRLITAVTAPVWAIIPRALGSGRGRAAGHVQGQSTAHGATRSLHRGEASFYWSGNLGWVRDHSWAVECTHSQHRQLNCPGRSGCYPIGTPSFEQPVHTASVTQVEVNNESCRESLKLSEGVRRQTRH